MLLWHFSYQVLLNTNSYQYYVKTQQFVTLFCMKQFEIGRTKSPWNQVPSNINSSHFAKTNFDNFGYLEIAKLHIQSMYVAKWPDSKLAQCFWAKILSIFFKRGNLSILKLLHFKRDCSYLSHCMVKANYKSL